MTTIITITRKGQTTLPIEFRRLLGLDKSGGTLRIRLDSAKGELTVSKAVSPAILSERLSAHIKPGTPPVMDADAYYQQNRDGSAE